MYTISKIKKFKEGTEAMRLNLRKESREEPTVVLPANRPAPVQKSTKIPAAGNLLRDRGKRSKAELSDIWSSRNIEDHIEPDEYEEQFSKIRSGLRRATKRSKQLMQTKRTVRQPQTTRTLPKTPQISKVTTRPVMKAAGSVSSLDMVQPTRAASGQRQAQSRSTRSFARHYHRFVVLISARRKVVGVIVFSCLAIFVASKALSVFDSSQSETDTNQKDALGASVSSEKIEDTSEDTGPEIVSSTEFELLTPSEKDQSAYEIALVSPPENTPVYAYIDKVDGVEIRLSQQEIPDSFKGELDVKLAEVAKDFQATDIIQIDDIKVYHGFTERFGGVQSLVFVKNDVMVFISSAAKLSDDTWAGYILNLQ